VSAFTVVTPAPRDTWQRVLSNDRDALPEDTPEWEDALMGGGSYRDASRLYPFADSREVVLPLVRRRGPIGLGGWLQSYPAGWGIGGLVGSDASADTVSEVPADLHRIRMQRIAIRPDPRCWPTWDGTLDDGSSVIPRRAHVIDSTGGEDAAWAKVSKSARRGVRTAERAGIRIIKTGHSGAHLEDYYGLFLLSVDRSAEQQHEPQALARARARRRDPMNKLQAMARHLGTRFVVTLAYLGDVPVAGSITLFGQTAHGTRSAMERVQMGSTGAGDLVLWTTIKMACDLACTAYRLGESGQSTTLAQFKEKFGARPHHYAELRLDRLPWSRSDAVACAVVKRILRFRDV
jgi:hypothetical protein